MVKEDWKSKVQTGWSRKLLTQNPNQKQFEYQFHQIQNEFSLYYGMSKNKLLIPKTHPPT